MRELFIILLLLNFHSKVSSQNIEKSIILKDADTNLPIEDATVLIFKTKQTFLSNSEGTVSFMLKGASNIQIKHSSYPSVTIRSSSLTESINVIFLKNNLVELDDIVVTRQHPQKVLRNLVENSMEKLTMPARLKVYSREFFKLDGEYSYFNDGLVNFQISGKTKDFDTKILVEQNRSYGLVKEEISDELLGYNLNNIMENYYNFKYLKPILDPKAKKEYDFLIKECAGNPAYYMMTVSPLKESKGLKDDFVIIYDYKKELIIETSSMLSLATLEKNPEKTAKGSKNIQKSLYKTIYRVDGANYYLLSSKEEIGYERVGNEKNTQIEVNNVFVTTNFSNQNYTYKENQVYTDKTLFNKKNAILTSYWNVSGLTATDKEKEIINSIAGRQ